MNLNVFVRKLYINRKYLIINIVGLSIALSSILLVFSFVKNELSYDRFHSKADRICRITQNTNTGISSMIDARFFRYKFLRLKQAHPEIEAITGLSSFRKAIVTIGDNSFYSTKVFGVDSSFFDVFDFKLIAGNKNTIFNNPNQAAITENLAKRYFGTTDVVGRQITIMHQRNDKAGVYTIKGVLKDFPENSHIKADILCSFRAAEMPLSWAYSYILLAKGVDCKALQASIQKQWDKENEARDTHPKVNLQPLTKIHLYSHKSREMEQNGNIRTLILLISGVLIILIVALINFLNFSYVRFLSELKYSRIKMVNGATKFNIIKEFFYETIALLVFVVTIGLLLKDFFQNYLHYNFYASQHELVFVIVCFALFIVFLALIPLFFRSFQENGSRVANHKKLYQISLAVQLLLSMAAISSTLFIQKQIAYTNRLHPKASDSNIIVIPRNPDVAVANFELLKEELLKYPEIIAACGVSEEPGGTVTDNFPYFYNGDTSTNGKTLNVLVTDKDFFSFMGIKAIAGTTDLGTIPTYEWEQKAMKLWYLERYNKKIPKGLKKEILSYSEKYIINKTALKHMGIKNPQDAIGKEFRINQQLNYLFPEGKIVGVVDDFHYTNVHDKVKPLAILPRKLFCHNFLFRIDAKNRAKALAIINRKWNEINKGIPFTYEFISESYHKVYKSEYQQMKVLSLFSVLSILLSIIGMYAMISYKLKQKTKEIGIRKVNGATVFEILKMLNADFVRLVTISFIISVPVTYYVMQKWLESFAYKTGLSWWVFAAAGLFVLLLTVITVTLQSLYIARKNPTEMIRYE